MLCEEQTRAEAGTSLLEYLAAIAVAAIAAGGSFAFASAQSKAQELGLAKARCLEAAREAARAAYMGDPAVRLAVSGDGFVVATSSGRRAFPLHAQIGGAPRNGGLAFYPSGLSQNGRFEVKTRGGGFELIVDTRSRARTEDLP